MSHDHPWFIALSYAITALAVLVTIAVIMLDHRRLKKALEKLGAPVDERGEDV